MEMMYDIILDAILLISYIFIHIKSVPTLNPYLH